jgi:polysaccharide biosynthesis protein PslG
MAAVPNHAYVRSTSILAIAVAILTFFRADDALLQINDEIKSPLSKKVIPESLFGLTVIRADLSPKIPVGSVRTWNSMGLAWPDINPGPNIYNWSTLDLSLRQAQKNGYDVLYTFGRTPRWASSKPNIPTPGYGLGQCAPPSNIQYWDDFLRAIAIHAAGRIKYWETWNEPQEFPPRGSYCGDIPTMVQLQQHEYEIIKSIDPAAMILTPSPSGGLGPRWMSTFLDAGGGEYADVMAFHGYANKDAESALPIINNFMRVFGSSHQGLKPTWDTEAGWGENRGLPDADQQAAFVAKFYLLRWSAGVERAYWYGYDEPQWGTLWDSANGLRKAGVAYSEVRKWMVGATLNDSCTAEYGAWTCRLSRPGGYQAIAAWSSGREVLLPINGDFTQYRDLTGVITKISGHVVLISNAPILVETDNSLPR